MPLGTESPEAVCNSRFVKSNCCINKCSPSLEQFYLFNSKPDVYWSLKEESGALAAYAYNPENTSLSILPSSDFPGTEQIDQTGLGSMDKDNYNLTIGTPIVSNYVEDSELILKIARNTTNNPRAYQSAGMIIGVRYVFYVEMRSDGFASPRITGGNKTITGTTSTDWQVFEFEHVAGAGNVQLVNVTSTGAQYVEARRLSVRAANPLNGDIFGANIGQNVNERLKFAYEFDGVFDYINVLSDELNDIIDYTTGGVGIFVDMAAGVWTDATERYLFNFYVDANNRIAAWKSAINNTIEFQIIMGGTDRTGSVDIDSLGLTDNFLHVFLTWDGTACIMYINGVARSIQGAVGAGVGNLTIATICSSTIIPNSATEGLACHIPLYIETPSANHIYQMARYGGVV